jgi:hypothetical protein
MAMASYLYPKLGIHRPSPSLALPIIQNEVDRPSCVVAGRVKGKGPARKGQGSLELPHSKSPDVQPKVSSDA